MALRTHRPTPTAGRRGTRASLPHHSSDPHMCPSGPRTPPLGGGTTPATRPPPPRTAVAQSRRCPPWPRPSWC
ncbi:hypothetical protein EFW17_00775 [Halostreptopolyspora alba]|uniref:Uncharacterized protein n=1 Tax=Halostreptopolyspora alba TaxID=2487137 RepID=A0A3N0EHU9_9ACTN|nr:hypothetical protein EFW17_00775 [Nocardiopsaceae bacterium YIM 96095]